MSQTEQLTPEALKAIAARKTAAQEWAINYNRTRKPKGKQQKALAVVALDVTVREFLAQHSPMTLRQVQEALDGTSYCDYLAINRRDGSRQNA